METRLNPVTHDQLSIAVLTAFENGWNPDNGKPGWKIDKTPFFDVTPRHAYTQRDMNNSVGLISRVSKELSGSNTYGCDIGAVDLTYATTILSAGIENVTVFEPMLLGSVEDARIKLDKTDLTRTEYLGPKFDVVSCISTIEHIGLGRYGDPIDPYGDIKMMDAIHKILKPEGRAILSFPYNSDPGSVGIIRWNGCRIYNWFRKDLLFKKFDVIMEENMDAPQPMWVLKKKI